MFLQFDIIDRMRARFYMSEDASHSFQKILYCVFVGLFLPSEPPAANRKPCPDVPASFPSLFVLLLLLPWLLTGNIPRKTSRDWLPLCFGAADSLWSAGCSCAPLRPGDWRKTVSQEEENRSWTQGKAHQGKKTDSGSARTPTIRWW